MRTCTLLSLGFVPAPVGGMCVTFAYVAEKCVCSHHLGPVLIPVLDEQVAKSEWLNIALPLRCDEDVCY
jgi:hypothetical protein